MPKSNPPPPSIEEMIAAYMVEQVTQTEYGLDQASLALQIKEKFGDEFVYDSETSGNPLISRKVLATFNKLTGDDVVWDFRLRLWRKRTEYDMPGRRQG